MYSSQTINKYYVEFIGKRLHAHTKTSAPLATEMHVLRQ